MVTSLVTTVFEVTLAGDASGVGAYLGNIQSETTLLSFPFSEEEAKGSSMFRELLVLERFYTSEEARKYAGRTILHYCDNQAVCSIMVKGSGKPHLQVLNIPLTVEWRSRHSGLRALKNGN